MKKIVLITLALLLISGCSLKENPDNKTANVTPTEEDEVVKTDDGQDNASVDTNQEDVKYEPAVRNIEMSKEEAKQKETKKTNNNKSESVKKKDVIVPNVEEKPKEETKIESEKKEQITNTDEKQNIIVDDKEPVKKEEPPKEDTSKEESNPINYKIGNSGKLFDTEQEADKEAERMFNDYSNPDKYISRYWIWSTYDKWTIEYEYTNWE